MRNTLLDDMMIRRSDIAVFGSMAEVMWINGTQPTLFCGEEFDMQMPDNKFPFTRLANIVSLDGSTFFLYHQINGTTFAEEQYDRTPQTWTDPEYIHISDD